ncbi:hypothetical protein BS47DRAFT_1390671 [Hydnum rufescens UP504]|uniref:Uncharacterized protein n=1 Tax=Hydnum rufescens UP504 TaxID=1448309 RepID=A0A9P6DWI1_9AGAM|nr:hypothetical protein BS47DRAFT_1390671 [Hydnum rufescens UP504]
MSAMSTSPAVLSGGGNLASSSSNPNRELEPGSVTSGEGALIPSSLQIDVLNRKACLESDDQMPLPMSTDLLGFPSPSDWKVANQKAQERIDSSNVVNIYNILEWLVVYTNSLRNFQFLGHWHGPDDIYNTSLLFPIQFNQFQPWYAYIKRLKSDPPFSHAGNSSKRLRCCTRGGWKLLGIGWGTSHNGRKRQSRQLHQSLCDELEDIQHKNKDVLHVNGLIITAYEFNGYASYLMFCCIDKLVETFKADAPVFCVDDRIIGAVFGNSVGDKETVWREELE